MYYSNKWYAMGRSNGIANYGLDFINTKSKDTLHIALKADAPLEIIQRILSIDAASISSMDSKSVIRYILHLVIQHN